MPAARVKCPHCNLRDDTGPICAHLEAIGMLVDTVDGLACAACGYYDQYFSNKIHHINTAGHDWPRVLTRRAMEEF